MDINKENELRKVFERKANDSFGFKRSRRGMYQNPSVARDWKWFLAGAEYKDTDMIKPEVIEKAKALANAVYIDALKYDAKLTTMNNKQLIERLRAAAQDIRRKPYPISDVIPMLVQAADALERADRAAVEADTALDGPMIKMFRED